MKIMKARITETHVRFDFITNKIILGFSYSPLLNPFSATYGIYIHPGDEKILNLLLQLYFDTDTLYDYSEFRNKIILIGKGNSSGIAFANPIKSNKWVILGSEFTRYYNNAEVREILDRKN